MLCHASMCQHAPWVVSPVHVLAVTACDCLCNMHSFVMQVTCEFCKDTYQFSEKDVTELAVAESL